MIIFLVGYMGCGKSTVGKKLGNKLNVIFFDLDNLIEKKHGKTISEIFAEVGEEKFRTYERAVLEETSQLNNAIIATGGGAPCFFDNMDLMNRTGTTVYLKMSPKGLFQRLKGARESRPLIASLNDDQLIEFIKVNLEKREKFYSQSQLVIKGESVDIESAVNEISLLARKSD